MEPRALCLWFTTPLLVSYPFTVHRRGNSMVTPPVGSASENLAAHGCGAHPSGQTSGGHPADDQLDHRLARAVLNFRAARSLKKSEPSQCHQTVFFLTIGRGSLMMLGMRMQQGRLYKKAAAHSTGGQDAGLELELCPRAAPGTRQDAQFLCAMAH